MRQGHGVQCCVSSSAQESFGHASTPLITPRLTGLLFLPPLPLPHPVGKSNWHPDFCPTRTFLPTSHSLTPLPPAHRPSLRLPSPPLPSPTGESDWHPDKKRLYEFVVRSFLACCSLDAVGYETTVTVSLEERVFKLCDQGACWCWVAAQLPGMLLYRRGRLRNHSHGEQMFSI